MSATFQSRHPRGNTNFFVSFYIRTNETSWDSYMPCTAMAHSPKSSWLDYWVDQPSLSSSTSSPVPSFIYSPFLMKNNILEYHSKLLGKSLREVVDPGNPSRSSPYYVDINFYRTYLILHSLLPSTSLRSHPIAT